MYTLEVLATTRDFYAYWYGTGELVDVEAQEDPERFVFTVDYGEDGYRAEYQSARFASGLIWAQVFVS